jgi:hypothetical protein
MTKIRKILFHKNTRLIYYKLLESTFSLLDLNQVNFHKEINFKSLTLLVNIHNYLI